MSDPHLQPRAPAATFAALCALVTLSGMCGLVFEVIWVKYLSLVVGHTTVAVSLVVAAFLGGLVLGSLILGRAVDRAARPLRVYALLELVIGLSALATTGLLAKLPEWMDQLGLPGPLRVLIATLVVLPPTFAMGGTLPAVVRFATRSLASVGRSFGVLYSLNTLGAAVGCGLAGFFLIGELGLLRTAFLASAINGVVAAAALLLDGRSRPATELRGAPSSFQLPELLDERGRKVLVVAFAACGFASISYEVLWFRVLSSSLESSAYAFTLLLVTFLLGLVLGGLLYTWKLSSVPRPLELFVGLQSLIALAGLMSMALLGQQRVLEQLVPSMLGALGAQDALYLSVALRAGLIILIPATLIGIAFPLIAQLTTRHLERVGGHIGLLYSVNTLGGIAGSLTMGFLAIPLLGTQRSFALVCALSMAVGLWVQRVDRSADTRARLRLYATAGLLGVGLLMLPSRYLQQAVAQFSDSKLLELREGRDGTLAVLQYDRESVCDSGLYECDLRCPGEFMHRQLLFGSVSYASTVPPAKRYMRALAHLPMLLSKDPGDVLEICFGTGTTAGSFTTHPALRSLTLVDLNPDVFAMARYFEESNLRVLEDPRTVKVVDDGRHYLGKTDQKFDVISLEPPPPRAAGAVNLYSREFYQLARERLSQGGVLAQWVPVEQQDDRLARMLLKAITDVFPHVQLWVPARLEGVVLASMQPLEIDLEQWQQRWRVPEVRENLAEVGYDGPESLLGAYLMDDATLRRYVAGVPAVTDDRPAIEYFLSTRDRPFSAQSLLEQASPVESLVGSSTLAADWARAHRMYIQAHALFRQGEKNLAWDQVELASRVVGDTPYTDFLKNLEYGCLGQRRAQPQPSAR